MEFVKIDIKNFRNFKNISLNLANKNIFFGLNDVGKTNFLYALRYIFDKNIRNFKLLDSDFHNKNVEEPIEIIVTLNISNGSSMDCQKLRARLDGALLSEHEEVYIKLKAEYDHQEMFAMPILYWGGDLENLREMKQRGYMYDLDYIFNVIYIDSFVDLHSLFKKNIKSLVKNENEEDENTITNIKESVNILNKHIASLSGIKIFEQNITSEYKKFYNEDISILVKSEIAIKGLFSNILPYIKQGEEDKIFPTAGEGRKKLLVYSIYDLLSNENAETKINLFLVEEPENHLHKSMQMALSQILFTESKYTYLFVTTHSPFVLYEMDNVNLIRIFSERKITSASTFYKVPKTFETSRKILNRSLAEAIFAEKVLLVEGPSEHLLFQKILSIIKPFYETNGIFILPVDGIGFKPYLSILKDLNIFYVIKTDNDLKKIKGKDEYSVLGFIRCNNYIEKKLLPEIPISKNLPEAKRELYNQNLENLNLIRRDYHIYLSKVDLENDLDEILHEKMLEILENEPVEYLQEAKRNHMVELIAKLSVADCKLIYEHYNFACIKEVINEVDTNTKTNY